MTDTPEPNEGATPRPWRFSPWHFEEDAPAVRAHFNHGDHIICTTASDADAALIVAAVNAYDWEREMKVRALVEAARAAFDRADDWACDYLQELGVREWNDHVWPALTALRAAIDPFQQDKEW